MADRQKKTGQKPTTKRSKKASPISCDISDYKQLQEVLRESEKWYRYLVEITSDWVWEVDKNTMYTYVSPKIRNILGYEPEEVLGKTPYDLMTPEEAKRVASIFRSHIPEHKPLNSIENVCQHKTGRLVVLETNGIPIFDQSGTFSGYLGSNRDVTQRKQAENGMEKLRRQSEMILKFAGEGILGLDLQGNHTFVNPIASKMLGYEVEELIDQPSHAIWHHSRADGSPYPEEECPIYMTHKDGEILHVRDEVFWRKDGTCFPVAYTSTPIVENGNIIGAVVTFWDITERKQVVEALRQSENKYRTLIENLPQKIFLKDKNSIYVSCNENYAHDLKIKPDEITGKTDYDFYPKELAEKYRADDQRIIELRNIEDIEERYIHDGQETWVHTIKIPVKDEKGNIAGILGIFWDITERKRTENELQESEEKFRTITTSAMDAITMMDNEGNVSFWNKGAEDIFGYSSQEILGKELHMVLAPQNYHEAFREGFKEFKNTGQGKAIGKTLELTAVKKDGTEIPIELSVSAVKLKGEWNAIGILRDISKRKQAEKQIQHQLQKLAALREIDRAISSSLDLYVTLKIFLDELVRQLHIDAADVLLLNPYTQTLEYTAGRGFHSKAVERSRVYLGEGHAGRSALKRRLIKIPNLSEAPGDLSRFALLEDEGFVTYYALPLIAKGQVKGVLEIFHRTLLDPDQEWINFLEALAGQVAIAIDNAELFNNMQRANIELTLAYDTTLEGWSRALDMRDKETEGHTQRVAEMTLLLARALKMGEAEMMHIRRGALLHDIGKMGVPDSILQKPGPLTEEEWEIMRKHPMYAYEMLSPIHFLRPALDIPYCHHEKWDGTGYPRGLKGELIPLSARIFSVVDVWDALRSNRPYRPAWPEDKVREYIRQLAEKDFDPKIVEVFLEAEKEW